MSWKADEISRYCTHYSELLFEIGLISQDQLSPTESVCLKTLICAALRMNEKDAKRLNLCLSEICRAPSSQRRTSLPLGFNHCRDLAALEACSPLTSSTGGRLTALLKTRNGTFRLLCLCAVHSSLYVCNKMASL